jgi:hypothetical protein
MDRRFSFVPEADSGGWLIDYRPISSTAWLGALRVAWVGHPRRWRRRDPQPPLNPAQQQNARVRRQHPAIESDSDLLPGDRW